MKISLLIADDEKASRDLTCLALSGWRKGEFKAVQAVSPEDALASARQESFHLALIDLHFSENAPEGYQLIERLRELDPGIELIVVSSDSRFESAQRAMRAGASDFLRKGFGREELVHALERALERRRWRKAERRAQAEGADFVIAGGSSATERMIADIRKVAPLELPVLLEGETGAGKEVAARALHAWGRDPLSAFVAVNCAAVPASTADSYFFGHEKGAFTGAVSSREGVFEEADGGTLFLDEINSLSLDLQGRLLRVLQEKEVRRLGGTKTRTVDFRLVAASNKDLKEMVAKGEFREDLYFRIQVFCVKIPPLRERLEDLDVLAAHFAPGRELKPEVKELFLRHTWPGNIREFRNVLLAMSAIAGEERCLDLTHLPDSVMQALAAAQEETGPEEEGISQFKDSQQERERDFLARTYRSCGGNVSKMARMLGLDRSHLHQKLVRLGIHRAKTV